VQEPEDISGDDALLDAARASILAVGWRRSTLTDVARRAGVSRMTVYREYGDAAALFRALLTESIGEVVFGAEADVGHLPTVRQRIVESVALTAERLAEHPMMRRVLELDPELLLPFVVDRFGSGQRLALEHLRGQLRTGIDEGSIRPLDVGPAARLILLTAQSVVFSTRIVEGPGSPSAAPGPDGAAALAKDLRSMLDSYLRPT
jgi:AcrR family transcriptional regulator